MNCKYSNYEIQRSVNGRDFNRIADMSPGNNQGGAAEYLYADNGVNERYLLLQG